MELLNDGKAGVVPLKTMSACHGSASSLLPYHITNASLSLDVMQSSVHFFAAD